MTAILRNIIPPLLVLMALGSCLVIDHSLMNGLISAKWLWLKVAALPIQLGCAVLLLRIRSAVRPTLNDVAVMVLMAYLIANPLLNQSAYRGQHYLILCILGLWLFIRLAIRNRKSINAIVVMYLSMVGFEAIKGLLQLYGLLSSNHSQFAISGSFHNPGPFSGFVVSGLPMAVGIYLSTRQKARSCYRKLLQLKWVTIDNDAEGKSSAFKMKEFFTKAFGFIKRLHVDVLLNLFSQLIILLLLLVLPATQSRAAWLAAIAGCVLLGYQMGYFDSVLKKYKLSCANLGLVKQCIIGITAFVLLSGSIYGLYQFKKGSADGRFLMWQVSWEMMKDKPLLGFGPGGFEAHYSNYQAEWFNSGKGTMEQELVAGTPDAPFNEFIRVGVEYGLIGVLLVLLVLCSLFFISSSTSTFSVKPLNAKRRTSNRQPEIYHLLQAALFSMVVFSLFSYPLDVAPIVVQLSILIALITNLKTTQSVRQNSQVITAKFLFRFAALAWLVVIPLVGYHTFNQYKGHKHWKEAYQLYKYQIYDDAAKEYGLALNYLPDDGLLLQMYGKCLAMSASSVQVPGCNEQLADASKQWHKALNILEMAKQYRSDPILYTSLGDTYKTLGQFEQARKSYEHAWRMVPHRFYPKYLLAKLYSETGQSRKAQQVAQELLSKKVKVESRAIEEMKVKLIRLLQE